MLRRTPLAASTQGLLKLLLGLSTVVCGFVLLWRSFQERGFGQAALLFGVVLVSAMIGRQLGRLARLQQASNHLGRMARDQMEATQPGRRVSFSESFNACTIVFCAAPLGMVGAVVDGLTGIWLPLAIKGLMDGLAMMGFVSMFGRASVTAALPVLVFQGSIALACRLYLAPWLSDHDLIAPVVGASGILMFAVALVILESKRIHLADYLPSLLVAPLLMAGLRAVAH